MKYSQHPHLASSIILDDSDRESLKGKTLTTDHAESIHRYNVPKDLNAPANAMGDAEDRHYASIDAPANGNL
jgi:hypothetical protein